MGVGKVLDDILSSLRKEDPPQKRERTPYQAGAIITAGGQARSLTARRGLAGQNWVPGDLTAGPAGYIVAQHERSDKMSETSKHDTDASPRRGSNKANPKALAELMDVLAAIMIEERINADQGQDTKAVRKKPPERRNSDNRP